MDCNSTTAIVMDFNAYWDACTAYWWVHAIDYWQGVNVKYGRHGLAHSVTKTQSHDEGRFEEA